MAFYDNDISFLTDPCGYLIKILDSYLPKGLKGCVARAESMPDPYTFNRLLKLDVVYPNGIKKYIVMQQPYITDYIDIYQKVARIIVETYYVEVG